MTQPSANDLQAAREIIRRAGKSPDGMTPGYLAKRMDRSTATALAILNALAKEKAAKPVEVLDPVVEHRLKRENRLLREQLHEALSKQVLDQEYQHFVSEVAQYRAVAPDWTLKARPHRAKQAIPVAHLSDAHFDENVDPAQVGYVNGYGRKIALGRLHRFGIKTILLCDEYLKGVDYQGIKLAVSGDMFSGNIHDELRETNESGLCASLVFWLDPMAALVNMLAERFGRVDVEWVVGNHPRLDKKPRAKGGVQENFDWLLGALLQREFGRAGDKRVTFHVSESFDNYFRVFNTRYLQTHGDQFKGGSGIAAELSPLMIGDARKREKQQAMGKPYDVLIMGHFHRRLCLPSIKSNGCLKGWDEYALKANLKYQEPLQSFWLDTPEHGITIEAPIYVKAPNEGWELEGAASE